MILWFDLLERFVGWICSNVILIQIPNILQFGWRMDRRSLERNYNKSLAMSLLEILCSSCFLCSSCALHLRRFVEEVLRGFRGLNLQSFTNLWFVRFLEAFELDSSELWDLGIWFGWFLFECSLDLKVCSGSSSGLWRLESVEFHQFVVCWGF